MKTVIKIQEPIQNQKIRVIEERQNRHLDITLKSTDLLY